jgi:hypothetical protein
MEFSPQQPKPQTNLIHFYSLLCLTIVIVIYTWPLLSQLTTAIPGTAADHDVATFVWNSGWVHGALQNGKPLLETDAVLLPFGANLRLHTYGLLQGFMAYPFRASLGVVGAFNLLLIASLWLNGLAVYVLIYDEVRQQAPALIAAVYAILGTPALVHFRVGRPSFAALWIIALAILAFRRLLTRPTPVNAVSLGLLLLAALLSDFQILFYTGLWLGFYGLYWILRYAKKQWGQQGTFLEKIPPAQRPNSIMRSWGLDRKRLGALLGSGTIFLIPFLAIYYPALALSGTGDYPQPGLHEMTTFSFALKHYFQWPVVPMVYGDYGLFLALLVAILFFRRRWVSRFWLFATGTFLLLALGPFLEPTEIPLPFAGFSILPMLRQFRTPSRLTVPALIGLGMIAGSLLAVWWPSLRKGPLTLAVLVILLSGRLGFALVHDPFLIQTYPTYAFYDQLAEEGGDFAILEVPFGVRSGLDRIGQGGEILQYYQHLHHKRLLNGMIARLPREVFVFYRTQPSLLFLSGEANIVTDAALRENLAEVLAWSESCYIIVHTAMLAGAEEEQRILAFLDTVSAVRRHTQEADLHIYAVDSSPNC